MSEKTSSAFVALLGKPNVGKSSLLNRLVGHKVAIVSNKPQTTRGRIMGVLTDGALQLVFVDTPGAHRPKNRLDDLMVDTITEAMSGVDAAILVADPTPEINEDERRLLAQIRQNDLPAVLAINKIDTVSDKKKLLACITAWQAEFDFAAYVPVSALTGEGVSDLLAELVPFSFESPHFFPDDVWSDQPEKVLAAEIVREKMLQTLRDDVPHGIAVVIEQMEKRGDILDVDALIICEREGHKGIVIGKRGAMLKKIATAAREDMERVFDCRVNLQTWVKVKEDWRNREGLLHSFGYQ